MLVSDSFRSQPTTTAETELRAASVSTASARADPDPPDTPSEYAHDHLDSLLRGLPSDLTDEQRDMQRHSSALARMSFQGPSTT